MWKKHRRKFEEVGKIFNLFLRFLLLMREEMSLKETGHKGEVIIERMDVCQEGVKMFQKKYDLLADELRVWKEKKE